MGDRHPRGTGKVYVGDQFLTAVTYALDVLAAHQTTPNLENPETPLADTNTTGRLTFRELVRKLQVEELLASNGVLTLELEDGRRFSFVHAPRVHVAGLRIPIRLMGSNP